MAETIKLPEPARLGLLELYLKSEAAKQLYVVAVNASLAALGLDPKANNAVDLDAGTVTPPDGG